MEKRKKGIIIGMTTLVLVILILLGLTYAYYRTRIIGNGAEKSLSVTSKKMEITYEDGTAVLSTEGKISPGFTASKTFYVKNTGDSDVSYSVLLDKITNEYIRNQDWQVTLTKNGESVIGESDNVYLAVGTHQVLLGRETIVASEGETTTDTYVLTVTYKNLEEIDQSEDMGSKLSFRVNIGEETYMWDNAPAGSLIYALKTNNTVTNNLSTIPGKESSGESEAIISTTEDDYGTSYYFRGAVENNYVTYSGMCWRIVRVQGDGTIKLILSDRDHVCSANVEANTEGEYLGYNSANGSQAFLAPFEQAFVYTNSSVNGHGVEDLSYKNSNIKKILEAWRDGLTYSYSADWFIDGSSSGTSKFEQKLDLSKLAITDWCNDYSMEVADYYNGWSYGNTKTNLTTRINNGTPTLKCNMIGVNVTVDGETVSLTKAERVTSNVGLLSADEIAFAGGTTTSQKKYYLSLNFVESEGMSDNWTLSIGEPIDSLGQWIIMNYNASLSNTLSQDPAKIRPAVVLNSNVMVTTNADVATYGEPGTQNNAYVIN